MRSYCVTDIGVKRNMNQDFVYASEQPVGNLPNLFIVADGMGGHNAGDLASRSTVETMVDYIESAGEKSPIPLLEAAILAANRKVMEKSQSDKSLEGMGTTVVAATVVEDCLYVANVGDSRLYVLDDQIQQITRDHSLVEEMVRAGQIGRDEARNHPEKNIITRAVGMKNKLRIDFFDVALYAGDKFLLCTDGLTNMVEDEDILELVQKETSLEAAAHRLVAMANRNGGKDNISVVLVEPMASGV